MITHDSHTIMLARHMKEGDCIHCGYNGEGEIEFGYDDKDGNYTPFFAVTRAQFDALCRDPLGIRPPQFEDDMKQYLDGKFAEIKKMLGA